MGVKDRARKLNDENRAVPLSRYPSADSAGAAALRALNARKLVARRDILAPTVPPLGVRVKYIECYISVC